MRKMFAVVLLFIGTVAFAQAPVPEFKVEKLADSLYALIRQDPVGWMVVSNCVTARCVRFCSPTEMHLFSASKETDFLFDEPCRRKIRRHLLSETVSCCVSATYILVENRV